MVQVEINKNKKKQQNLREKKGEKKEEGRITQIRLGKK
jgi:hypothetical protein